MMDFREDSFEERMRSAFGDPDPQLPHRRMIVLPWLICALVIGIVMAAALYPVLSQAAPVTRGHPADCDYFSDMAVTARALAQEGVKKDVTARIFGHVYDLNAPFRPEISAEIINAAYRTSDDPRTFAGQLHFLCSRQGGDMHQLLIPRTM